MHTATIGGDNFLETLDCAHDCHIRHVLKKPISLECGHYVCKECVYSRNNDKHGKTDNDDHYSDVYKVFCRFCSDYFVQLKMKSSKIAELCLKQNRNALFKVISKRYETEYMHLLDEIASIQEAITNGCERERQTILASKYACDESIQMRQSLERCIQQIRKEWKCQVEVLNFFDVHGKELKQMEKTLISNKTGAPVDEELFYDYQNKLAHLFHTNRNLKYFDCEEIFLNVFAYFSSETVEYLDNTFQTVMDRLKSSLYGLLDVDKKYYISDMKVLNDNMLLTANLTSLSLYNRNLELTKEITNFIACFVATNKIDRIYVCGCRKLIMMDFDFNIIDTIESTDELIFGHLAYSNDALYVCDPENKKINKYNSNLVYQDSYQLSFSPKQIDISNGLACIIDYQHVYFFELSPLFKLKTIHLYHNCAHFSTEAKSTALLGSICYAEPNFYVFCSGLNNDNASYFNVYDKSGSFQERIYRSNMLEIDFANEHPICYFNGKLILSASKLRKLVLM